MRDAVGKASQSSEAVNELRDAASQIGNFIEIINGLAEQTNLLALNATIEAARAGDAGKGFAVVASEVKSLADQTAAATQNIAQRIAEIQSSTGETVEAISHITDTVTRLNANTATISEAVALQESATRRISENVGRAARSARDMSGLSESVAGTARDTEGGADRLREATAGLVSGTAELETQLLDFIAELRGPRAA